MGRGRERGGSGKDSDGTMNSQICCWHCCGCCLFEGGNETKGDVGRRRGEWEKKGKKGRKKIGKNVGFIK